MAFRTVNALMALIFLTAVVVQYNDPDPVRWMAIYGAACLLSVMALKRRVHPAVPLLVAAVAVVWSAAIMFGGPGGTNYLHMFDEWEMRSVSVEQAREATGLVIVAAWMAVLAARGKRPARATVRAG